MAEYPPSYGAKTLLTAHASTSGWNLQVGVMPDTPDKVISINDTGGYDPNPKWLLDNLTLQVMVRGAVGGYLATYQEAKTVKNILLGLTSQNISGDRWVSVTQAGDLAFIGRDEQMRPLFSMNFVLIIQPQTATDQNRLPLP